MKTNSIISSLIVSLISSVLLLSSCKKKDDPEPDPGTGSGASYALIIENGAQSMKPDETITFSARLVDTDGNVSTPSGVSWSVSNGSIASISSGGTFSAVTTGIVTVTAKVSVDGTELTCTVPVNVNVPGIFAVAPSAIIWEVGAGDIPLEVVHFGTASPTYTYTSSDASIASVNSSGVVSFHAPGLCEITVKASTAPNSPVIVPVWVVGTPSVTLPVTRVKLDPVSANIFRGDTYNFSAQAFNSSGDPVSTSFTWSSQDPSIASVDASGTVTGHQVGSTFIHATTQGISGQAEIIVNPDTVVILDPIWADIPAGGNKTFTATAYNARTGMTPITSITSFNWDIPTYGVSIFDIATVDATGKVTVKNDALPGLSTFVIASVPGNPNAVGAAMISVALCDCGTGNPDVNSISISNGDPISLSMFGSPFVTINATAYDALGGVVSSPELKFCSDNMTVATVDESTGEVTAVSPGTATITVCSGSYASTTITVNVSL